MEPNGARGFYLNDSGTVDNTIYPNGIGGTLANISNDSFANMFNSTWAEQLIYYHPEYAKLHFAETNLTSTYAYLDGMLQCTTWAQAAANGYTTPMTHDPYFVNNYTPADVTTMNQDLIKYIGTPPSGQQSSNNIEISIWRIANGLALCDSTQPYQVREGCMLQMDSVAIDPSATTTAQQNAVWQAFKGIYLGIRNDMVISYINAQTASSLSAAAMKELDSGANEGNKQLRFATSATQAQQNAWSFWGTATSNAVGDSVTMTNLANSYVAANSIDACAAQIPFWTARLEQCEVLQQYLANQDHADSVTVNNIITAIVDSMVMVCHNSIDAYDPSGATNVNPAKLPVVPANFENIVNHVFAQYGIATLPNNYYFCNPYSVDYPKPYGLNPQLNVVNAGSADSCNCAQFATLMANASAAGVNTSSQSAVNAWLLTNYNDTLSSALWTGLQSCASHIWLQLYCPPGANPKLGGCYNVYNPITLGAVVEIPAFLQCGYVRPCLLCDSLQSYTAAFRALYSAYAGVPYTNGGTTDTGMAKQNALWARYLNYKTGFSRSANDYAAAFLNCGLSSGSVHLVLTSRSAQPPGGSGAPETYTADSSIVFSSGYTSNPGDNFQSVIAQTLSSTSTAICDLDKPLSYVAMPDTAQHNPCQAVRDQANFQAQLLFQNMQDFACGEFRQPIPGQVSRGAERGSILCILPAF